MDKTNPDDPEKIGEAYVQALKGLYNVSRHDPDSREECVATCRTLRGKVIEAKLDPKEFEQQVAQLRMSEQ